MKHISQASSPWLQAVQQEHADRIRRFGRHADGLTERINAVTARHPWSSNTACRYGDPLSVMVTGIAAHEAAGERILATQGCERLSRFVSDLLAEGGPDLSLAMVLYLDVSKLFGAAGKEAGANKEWFASAVLIEYATDWLQRGLTFVGASVQQVTDMVTAIAAMPLKRGAA